jgi:hypothetical protein
VAVAYLLEDSTLALGKDESQYCRCPRVPICLVLINTSSSMSSNIEGRSHSELSFEESTKMTVPRFHIMS